MQISNFFGVAAIAAGGSYSSALKMDGSVWAWGYNCCGQIGDGTRTDRWYPVQVIAGNDTTPPTGGVVINGGAAYASSTSVSLTLSAADNTGVAAMQFSNDGSNWNAPLSYSTTANWTLTSGDGVKTVYVEFLDAAGNVSAPASASITLETTPPTGSIVINGGAAYTSSNSVTLTLSATDSSGVAAMKLSNDGVNWSAPLSYSTSANWTLTSGDGVKTVYVEFMDGAGNASAPASASIALDTTLPTGSIVINGGAAYTSSNSVTLTLSATDSSGVAAMKLSNDGVNWSAPSSYSTSANWTLASGDGVKTVYVEFMDGAGNASAPASASITLDTTLPTGSIVINGGAAYTLSNSVTLTLSATDSSGVAAMKFSNDGVNWSVPQAYATSANWTLAGGSGLESVEAKFVDSAGNVSSPASASIVVGNPVTLAQGKAEPGNAEAIVAGSVVTACFSDAIYIEEPDRTAGMRVSPAPAGVSVGQTIDVAGAITVTGGEKTLILQTFDIAGTGTVGPLAMANKWVGGGNWGYVASTGEGQQGVRPTGLNNMGLLITTWGSVVGYEQVSSPSWFTISDGGGVTITCSLPPGVAFDPGWQYVCVTGICSCQQSGSILSNLVRVRQPSDITVILKSN